MAKNEKIKLVKLGDKEGCIFDDLVQIQISPDWLENITNIFKEKSLSEMLNYDSQGLFREKADFFSLALETWRKERNEINKLAKDSIYKDR